MIELIPKFFIKLSLRKNERIYERIQKQAHE